MYLNIFYIIGNISFMYLDMGGDHLTMNYFDNLDNGFSNKYEKNLKNRKKKILWICSSTYID
jgi:hypothetical protein